MAKSKAQRMREYRERKKQQLGEDEWLRRERARTKSYFTPMAMMSEENQLKVRERNRKCQERFRKKKQQQTENESENLDTEMIDETQPHSSTQTKEDEVSSSTDLLTVKFPAFSRSAKGKKRVSRALARANRRIDTLEDKNEELKKKLRSAQRRLQRYNELKQKKANTNTPKGKTDRLLEDSGLDPKQVPEIRKKLIYAECLSLEVKKAKEDPANKTVRSQIIHRVASGNVMKKYRMMSTLEQHTRLNRKKSFASKSIRVSRKVRLNAIRKGIQSKVTEFLERDDNSRVMPGKADAVKVKTSKVQKRVLNDFMYNLHQKFLAESDVKIGQSCFYKCRPKHISPVNFASRSVCLCARHQNFCFLLRSMKTHNLTSCQNPDKFVELYKDNPGLLHDLLERLPTNGEHIKFQQWKRVKLKNGKERQRVVEVEKCRTEFIEMVLKEFEDFKCHVDRVRKQYVAVKDMKDKLPSNHVLVQMDFSENYTCNTLEEIQSAYWNSCMVTLHPTVIYARSTDNELKHTSYVYVSEVLNHNATMVITIIDSLMSVVKSLVPNIECVHFWTDSPSSQYRNKTIFDLVSRFQERFGVGASWHYFEAGHGKGPCDGVGGTTKRNADNAVKQGKVLIQDAQDFYSWASKTEKGIKYELISEEAYNKTKAEVDKRNAHIKPLKGSMSLHAVVGLGDGQLLTRTTSCACNNCFTRSFNKESECGWNQTRIEEKAVEQAPACITSECVEPETIEESTSVSQEQQCLDSVCSSSIEEGVFVVARYDDRNYIGQVIEVCSDDTYFISFMTDSGKRKGCFKWPATEDKILRDLTDIVQVIEDPVTTTKTGRLFSVPEYVLKLIYG